MPDADPAIRIVRSDVGSYLKLVGPVVIWGRGHNLPPLVEIGLTDKPTPG